MTAFTGGSLAPYSFNVSDRPDSTEQPSTDPPPQIGVVRRTLQALLRTDGDFEAFCLDQFPEVFQRFSRGMDRVEKTNLLLTIADPTTVLTRLRECSTEDLSVQATIEQFSAPAGSEEQRRAREPWDKLDSLYVRRAELRAQGHSTDTIDKEIVNFKRAQRPRSEISEGYVLNGRYRLIESIGRGGFARVWKAFDRERKNFVAVKILHGDQSDDLRRIERFYRGAEKMQCLDHPNIVRVLDGPTEFKNTHYFTMEYLSGGDLHRAIINKSLDIPSAIRAIMEIGSALDYAHEQGLVHRDVKPQNILLNDHGRAFLTDFDLVWATDTTGGTRTGFLGTHIYAAPEQAEDAKSIDHRVDIYSLGMTVLFVLNGGSLSQRALYQRTAFINELTCSESLKSLLRDATAFEKEDRPQNMAIFCAELSAAFDSNPTEGLTAEPSAQRSQEVPLIESGAPSVDESTNTLHANVIKGPVPFVDVSQTGGTETQALLASRFLGNAAAERKVQHDQLNQLLTPPRNRKFQAISLGSAGVILVGALLWFRLTSPSPAEPAATTDKLDMMRLSGPPALPVLDMLQPGASGALLRGGQIRNPFPASLGQEKSTSRRDAPAISMSSPRTDERRSANPTVQVTGAQKPSIVLPTGAPRPTKLTTLSSQEKTIKPKEEPDLPEEKDTGGGDGVPGGVEGGVLGGVVGVPPPPLESKPPPTVSKPPPKPRIVSAIQIRSEKLTGEDPHLPAVVKAEIRKKGGGDVMGRYKMCIGLDGAIDDVEVVTSIKGADESILEVLRTWRYKPQTIPKCFIQNLQYVFE